MVPKVVEQILIRVQFEILATDFQRDDPFIRQVRRIAAMPERVFLE
jgi:hypothetical protein